MRELRRGLLLDDSSRPGCIGLYGLSWGPVYYNNGQHGLLRLRVVRRGAVHLLGMQHLCEYGVRSMSWGSVYDYGRQHGLLGLRILQCRTVRFRGMQHLCEYRLHVVSWGPVHNHVGELKLHGLCGRIFLRYRDRHNKLHTVRCGTLPCDDRVVGLNELYGLRCRHLRFLHRHVDLHFLRRWLVSCHDRRLGVDELYRLRSG